MTGCVIMSKGEDDSYEILFEDGTQTGEIKNCP